MTQCRVERLTAVIIVVGLRADDTMSLSSQHDPKERRGTPTFVVSLVSVDKCSMGSARFNSNVRKCGKQTDRQTEFNFRFI